MPGYLIDTNILIDALRRKRGRWELLTGLVFAEGSLGCSAVTVAELFAGMKEHEKVLDAIDKAAKTQGGSLWRKLTNPA